MFVKRCENVAGKPHVFMDEDSVCTRPLRCALCCWKCCLARALVAIAAGGDELCLWGARGVLHLRSGYSDSINLVKLTGDA